MERGREARTSASILRGNMVHIWIARTTKGRILFCSSEPYEEVERIAKEMVKDTGEEYVIVE